MNNDVRPGKGSVKTVLTPTPPQKAVIDPTAAFVTPEEAAATDDFSQSATLVKTTNADEQSSEPKQSWWHWPPNNRREWLVIAGLGLVIIIVIGALLFHHKPAKTVVVKVTAKPAVKAVVAPTTVPSTLSGLPVAPSVNNGPVTAVMVENSTDARPQSGLSQAGVVFEAIAEGGVTRFMALYQDTAPTNVGPIRSARPYYIQWSLGFDAGYAHVGGSPDGLADIKAWGVRDLDEFANGSYYHRISTRAAPHNVYTGIPTLNQLEAKKGYTSSTYTGFVRKAAAPAKQPTPTTINLTLSGSVYNAQYSYDAATNSYNRSEGGAAQTDANNNQQLSPKVVIAMVVPETQGALDASGAYYSNYNVIGSGPVYVFQDGTVTTGTWTKSSNTSQITFTNASGKTIGLDPGQTWVTAVLKSSDVSYH